MKFFVAGRWTDRERIHEIMRQIQCAGHSITRDWTTFEASEGDAKALREYSLNDIEGVKACDVFIFVADKDAQWRGAYAELGAAIAWGKPCFIIGEYADRCIHSRHPLVHRVSSIEEALNA